MIAVLHGTAPLLKRGPLAFLTPSTRGLVFDAGSTLIRGQARPDGPDIPNSPPSGHRNRFFKMKIAFAGRSAKRRIR